MVLRIGGLSIGEPKQVTFDITEQTTALLPLDKPRYLMGVGAPEDVVECVARGIDIFDCAMPTRVARNGALYTRAGRVDIENAIYSQQAGPIDNTCHCYTCSNFSAAYLHHLFRSKELLAYRLATIHNLAFMSNLVQDVRNSILDGTFDKFRSNFLSTYKTTDEQTRISQKQKWFEARQKRISGLKKQSALFILFADNRIAAVFAIDISDDIQFGEFHIQSVVNQQPVRQQRTDPGDIFDNFGSFNRPDNRRCRAENREFCFRRRGMIKAFEAGAFSGDYGHRPAFQSGDGAVNKRNPVFNRGFIQQIPGRHVIHRVHDDIKPCRQLRGITFVDSVCEQFR